jgi:hypothetical protein
MKHGLICLLLCAWVLWQNGLFQGAKWETVNGYPTYQECVDMQKFFREEDKKDKTRTAYQCLPDTVDPREQKR